MLRPCRNKHRDSVRRTPAQYYSEVPLLQYFSSIFHTDGHMMSYRSECWGRGDDDVMDAAGGSAHSDEVLQGCRGRGYYLARWLQRHGGHGSASVSYYYYYYCCYYCCYYVCR